MAYKYTHFIAQNIAPKGAERIIVCDSDGTEVCSIPLGTMAQPTKQKLYSFGLVSDIHLYDTAENNSQEIPSVDVGVWKPNAKFDNALTYFENQGCAFCCISGDLTQTGFYSRTDENDASTTRLYEGQLAKYKEICDKHSIPVYEIAGNHESFYGMPVSDNLTKWRTYTGENALHYTVSQGNDLFIFLGQPSASTPMSDEALQWLYDTLESNRNKRCFIFVHPHISSGNALGAYTSNNFFGSWGVKTDAFKNLLKHYKNTIVFHGHSHLKFECQKEDKEANYSEKDGFKSVHVSSLGRPRDIGNITMHNYLENESQGYIVDVYDDYIILNGLDFINNGADVNIIPIATYKIDTKLQTIPAKTFTDSTGTITT